MNMNIVTVQCIDRTNWKCTWINGLGLKTAYTLLIQKLDFPPAQAKIEFLARLKLHLYKISFLDSVPYVIVGQVVLSEGDVDSHHDPNHAGNNKIFVKNNAGCNHKSSIGEESGVVNVEYFT